MTTPHRPTTLLKVRMPRPTAPAAANKAKPEPKVDSLGETYMFEEENTVEQTSNDIDDFEKRLQGKIDRKPAVTAASRSGKAAPAGTKPSAVAMKPTKPAIAISKKGGATVYDEEQEELKQEQQQVKNAMSELDRFEQQHGMAIPDSP